MTFSRPSHRVLDQPLDRAVLLAQLVQAPGDHVFQGLRRHVRHGTTALMLALRALVVEVGFVSSAVAVVGRHEGTTPSTPDQAL